MDGYRSLRTGQTVRFECEYFSKRPGRVRLPSKQRDGDRLTRSRAAAHPGPARDPLRTSTVRGTCRGLRWLATGRAGQCVE
ncbi:hypothetical protein [Microlunatus elymi]